jgi:hypothetical protein
MNTIELYVNNKIFYPTIIRENNKPEIVHISNTIMEQLEEDDFKFFGKIYFEKRIEEMIFRENKNLYQVKSWIVKKISPEGIDIFFGMTQLI